MGCVVNRFEHVWGGGWGGPGAEPCMQTPVNRQIHTTENITCATPLVYEISDLLVPPIWVLNPFWSFLTRLCSFPINPTDQGFTSV